MVCLHNNIIHAGSDVRVQVAEIIITNREKECVRFNKLETNKCVHSRTFSPVPKISYLNNVNKFVFNSIVIVDNSKSQFYF